MSVRDRSTTTAVVVLAKGWATQQKHLSVPTLIAFMLCSGAAQSQDLDPRFELTLQAGYRIGGEFEDPADDSNGFELREGDAQRLTLNVAAQQPNTQWEMLFARQQTTLETDDIFAGQTLLDIDVEYLHFGGTYLFDGGDYYPFIYPFIAMTAGLTRFEPRASDLDAENYFSGSFGGGLQLRANKRVGVRLEARAFATLANDDGGLFCRSGPNASFCAIYIDGNLVVQWEAGVGLVARF